jgi:hypothetical protein
MAQETLTSLGPYFYFLISLSSLTSPSPVCHCPRSIIPHRQLLSLVIHPVSSGSQNWGAVAGLFLLLAVLFPIPPRKCSWRQLRVLVWCLGCCLMLAIRGGVSCRWVVKVGGCGCAIVVQSHYYSS